MVADICVIMRMDTYMVIAHIMRRSLVELCLVTTMYIFCDDGVYAYSDDGYVYDDERARTTL